jgi:hypothetical protein
MKEFLYRKSFGGSTGGAFGAHTAIYVSSYCCICLLILLYMCPQVRQVGSSAALPEQGSEEERLVPLLEQASVEGPSALLLSRQLEERSEVVLGRQRGGRWVEEEGLVPEEHSVHQVGLVRQLEERSEEERLGPLLQEVGLVRQERWVWRDELCTSCMIGFVGGISFQFLFIFH